MEYSRWNPHGTFHPTCTRVDVDCHDVHLQLQEANVHHRETKSNHPMKHTRSDSKYEMRRAKRAKLYVGERWEITSCA